MDQAVLERVRQLLEKHGVSYYQMNHEPSYTSEQAAQLRGTRLETGAKTLICKANKAFQMFVMPASMKLHTRAVRKALGIQRLRFATNEELFELTGLQPGCIPPFGSLFGLSTWCDQHLAGQSRINFSAGEHTVSMRILFEDYLRIETPRLARIAR